MGLFSKKKDKSGKDSPAPATNPYAAPPASDPYAQPPPSYSGGADNSFRQEKTPAVTGPGQSYGQRPGGYGAQGASYGAQSGYGQDAYGGGPPQRPGGYGGLGRTASNDTMSTEAGRNELFGNAPTRQQAQPAQPPQQSGGYGGAQSGGYGGGAPGGYGSATPGGYGAYEERQLTAEEQEEEDIEATKQEIKFMKQQDVSSTRNALRLAEQAMETGRGTLSTLGAQGERIHNTERNLDLASIQSDRANGQTKELARINASMFSIVPNPFTGNSKREKEMQKAMDQHARDRETREATNRAAWHSANRVNEAQRGIGGAAAGAGAANSGSKLSRMNNYQFEADEEDEDMERQIDDNLTQLHTMAKGLNQLGRAIGTEVDAQNEHITRITGKTDQVDDKIARNRLKLERIR